MAHDNAKEYGVDEYFNIPQSVNFSKFHQIALQL